MRCVAPVRIRHPIHQFVDVPCNKCYACLIRRQKEWIVRLSQEAKSSSDVHFVTLTYDEQSLPWGSILPVLDKKGIQKFMKRLRKGLQPGIKYYLVGEYGTITKRPHYHMIIYNTGLNKDQLTIKLLNAWRDQDKMLTGHLQCEVPDQNHGVMDYVAKYLVKSDNIDYEVKPFALMSKGLGKRYIEKSSEFHTSDLSRNYTVLPGGVKYPLPKYYKEKMLNEDQRQIMTAKSKAMIQKNEQKNPVINPALQTQRSEAFRRMLINKNNQNSSL